MMRLLKVGAIAGMLLVTLAANVQAVNVTVKNNCGYQIALGVYPPVWNNGGGFLGAGASVTFAQWASGTGGRIWSRHNCTVPASGRAICSSGMCGGTGIACAGSTAAGVTEAEINFNASGTDWYDISYVDGFNDMASIAPGNGGYASSCTSKPACTTATGDGYGAAGDTCLSPCTWQNTDQYCCRGAYNVSSTCVVANWPAAGKNYVNGIHGACNGAYTYAYDDSAGLHTTPAGSNYNVVFCPSGGGTAGTTTGTTSTTTTGSGGTLTAGLHQLSPACATGSRLDDNAAGTANGTKIQIWASNGSNAQKWSFASVGTNVWNAAVNLGPYCLDAANAAQGTQWQIWGCNGTATQKLTSTAVTGGRYTFKNGINGLCMDVSGASATNGTKVQSWACNGGTAQAWAVLAP